MNCHFWNITGSSFQSNINPHIFCMPIKEFYIFCTISPMLTQCWKIVGTMRKHLCFSISNHTHRQNASSITIILYCRLLGTKGSSKCPLPVLYNIRGSWLSVELLCLRVLIKFFRISIKDSWKPWSNAWRYDSFSILWNCTGIHRINTSLSIS